MRENCRFVIDGWERGAGNSRFAGAQVGPERAVCKIGFAAIGEAQGPKLGQRLSAEQVAVEVVEMNAVAFRADGHEAPIETPKIAGAGDDFGARAALGERHLRDMIGFEPVVGVEEQIAVVVEGGGGHQANNPRGVAAVVERYRQPKVHDGPVVDFGSGWPSATMMWSVGTF